MKGEKVICTSFLFLVLAIAVCISAQKTHQWALLQQKKKLKNGAKILIISTIKIVGATMLFIEK